MAWTGKVLKFLIGILIVPVSKLRDGSYAFSMKSFRFALSVLIWILTTWACTVTILIVHAQNLSTTALVVSYIGNLSKIMSITLMIPCLGYLVETARLGPADMTGLKHNALLLAYVVLIVLDTIFDIYICATASLDKFLFSILEIVVTTIVNIIQTSNLVLVKMYSNAFVAHMCEGVSNKARSTYELQGRSRTILHGYRNLKTGMGPLLLVMFSLGTIYITAYLYEITKLQSYPDDWAVILNLASKMLSKFLQLMIVSLACQRCYTELKGTKQFFR